MCSCHLYSGAIAKRCELATYATVIERDDAASSSANDAIRSPAGDQAEEGAKARDDRRRPHFAVAGASSLTAATQRKP